MPELPEFDDMDTETNFSLSDELQELSIDQRPAYIKSAEEIEKHSVDERLSDIERAVYLLSSGQEVQRISVITQIPHLLHDNNADCMRRVVPKVREVLHVAQAEMQLAACNAFLQILQKQLVPVNNYTQTFLQTILMSLDSRDVDVADAWLETLLDVIDLLPKDVIKRDIMGVAIAKGQMTKPVQSRLASCRILGKIATKFDPFLIRKEILPVVQCLCQDIDYDVRGCMCRQLDPVARGMGLDSTKSAILPELVELANDEESSVRLAGIETVVNILSLLDDDTCSNTIIPLVKKFCENALASEDATLPTVAKQLGRLCHGLSVNLTDEQKKWFLDFYRKLCRYGLSDKSKSNKETESNSPPKQPVVSFFTPPDLEETEDISVECRHNAGYNMPAMVLFAGARNFKPELYQAFHSICGDPNYHVRRTVASGFHEIAKILGNHVQLIISDLVILLRDDSPEVLHGILSHLPESLDAVSKCLTQQNSSQDTKHSELHTVMVAVLACEGVVFASNDWRLQEDYLHRLSCLPKAFTSEQIYGKLTPLLFKKLHNARALPVRHAAARSLLVLLRHNTRSEQRQEMCIKIVEEFSYASSCHKRSLFIDICKLVMELFSRKFFKEYFFEHLLELATDKVPNIRLKLCPLLPKLKAHIKLPSDRNLLQKLESAVRKLLMNESDNDVCEEIKKAIEILDRTQVQMESLLKKMFLEEDVADQKKEEEEKQLLEKEEADRKEEEARASKSEKKRGDKSKSDSVSRIPGPKRGSKIPAATSMSREKAGLSTPTRTERSSSFSSTSITPKESPPVRRTPSFNTSSTKSTGMKGSKSNLRNNNSPKGSTSRLAGGSASSTSSRKGSASSVASSASSTSSVGSSRRLSVDNSLHNNLIESNHKNTTSHHRRISTGSMGGSSTGIGSTQATARRKTPAK